MLMKYLVIGLGIYGSNLAVDLAALGHEVIGADTDATLVEAIKNDITTAYIIDSTEEASLEMLPLKNIDLVIVAIGENFGASVKTVALLKQMGVAHIYARAVDPLHQAILEGLNVDRIITPEQRAARDLVNEIELGSHVDSMEIDDRVRVMKFVAPSLFYGTVYSRLELEKDYGLTLITATRPVETHNAVGMVHLRPRVIAVHSDTLVVADGDCFVCLGSKEAWRSLFNNLKMQ